MGNVAMDELLDQTEDFEEVELDLVFDYLVHDDDVQASSQAAFVNRVSVIWFTRCCISEKQEKIIRQIYTSFTQKQQASGQERSKNSRSNDRCLEKIFELPSPNSL
jgi:hypothetical protein